MKQNGILFAGLFIGIGILLCGMQINRGISKQQDSQRVISVKGLSEREIPADRVTWPIVFKEVNNDLLALYSNLEQKNGKVISFLKANGLSEDEIIIGAPDIIDFQAERYGSQENRFRYNGTSVITVSSSKVDIVRSLIPKTTQLIKEGIAISANKNYEFPVNYEFSQLNSVKPEMVEEATHNARITAEKFASDSDSKLGKIKTATQGQMSISNRDETTPHIKTLRVVTTIVYYLKD